MADEIRVRYPFLSLRYRNFIRLQGVIIGALVVAAGVLFTEARGHPFWLLAHGWWILLLVAALEVGESWLLIRRARIRAGQSDSGDQP